MIATRQRSFAGSGHKNIFLHFSLKNRFAYIIGRIISLTDFCNKSFHDVVKREKYLFLRLKNNNFWKVRKLKYIATMAMSQNPKDMADTNLF